MSFDTVKKKFCAYPWPNGVNAYLGLAIVFILALVFRLWDLQDRWLWYDELQSVTHSSLSPLGELLRSVRHFDPHPPLYYIQLHFWMLPDKSTWWIKLNSVMWSALTLVMIFAAGRNLFNRRVALVACLFFALSPYGILYAQEARMYSMLMFLGMGAFYLLEKYFQKDRIVFLIGSMMLMLAFLYSHGAGFMILISMSVYAALRLFQIGRLAWKKTLLVGLALAVVLVLYIPWLRLASHISVGHTMKPDLMDVIQTLFIVIFGKTDLQNWIQITAVAIFCGMILSGFFLNRKTRILTGAFILVPILSCLLISHFYRPVWLHRTLAYTVPFWSIALAVSICHDLPGRLSNPVYRKYIQAGLTSLVILALSVCAVVQQSTYLYNWHFPDAARFLETHAKKGDIVHIPHERVLWGMGWYLAGPGSVDPFKTNQGVTSPAGLHLVLRQGHAPVPPNANNWLVCRNIDNVKGFAIPADEQIHTFGRLRVILLAP
ncbi:MAG: glycosyltransferase family 39 protein [Smithellaceae bacterium]